MKKIRVILFAVLLALSSVSCSGLTGLATDAAIGAVTGGSDSGLSVDTEIVAGDKTQGLTGESQDGAKFDEVDLRDNAQMEVNTDNTNKDREINGDSVTYKEGVSFWQAGLFAIVTWLLGLFMPQLQVKRKR